MSPFTGEGIAEIKKRSKGRSELSGRTDRPLECSHFDHTRNERYNLPENGIRLTVIEHLAYHLFFRDNASKIGLSEWGNDRAIDLCMQRATVFMEKIGKLSILNDEISDSILMWESILKK